MRSIACPSCRLKHRRDEYVFRDDNGKVRRLLPPLRCPSCAVSLQIDKSIYCGLVCIFISMYYVFHNMDISDFYILGLLNIILAYILGQRIIIVKVQKNENG